MARASLAMGKHAVKHTVRNFVPRLGRSRSITRLSRPNYCTWALYIPLAHRQLGPMSDVTSLRAPAGVPSESSLKRNGPPSECPLVQYLFSFLSPPRINASPSTASLASDVKPVLLAVYTIEEKLKCCQMMISYSSYREWRKKIYLYIHRNEQTRPTWVNGLV